MAVENKIVTIKKRTGALVPFDPERIQKAILKATQDIGGFKQDIIPDTIYSAFKEKTDDEIAALLTDDVIMCLNSHQSYQNPISAPDVETIQNHVVHVLRSRGFVDTADVYETYRWGKARVREGELTQEQFASSGYPRAEMDAQYRWNCQHNCETIQKLNAWVLSGRFKDLVDASIAEYDHQLDQVATLFLAKKGARIFFIAGPSSSGKTSTTSKLAQRLAKEGLRFHELNLDDYFKGLSEYPRDAFGDWDFETPQSLRLDLINQHLVELLDGKTIYKPIYDFKLGRSVLEAEEVRIESDEILLLDSLHGLYPPMTSCVPETVKFKLFIEAFSMIRHGDGTDGIITKGTDIRMLRRMLRDRTQRNHQPQMTLGHWHFVRKGELRDMIPYIKTVDYVMNGGLSFELPVLKTVMGNEFPDPKWFLNQGRLDAYIRGERVRRILETLMSVKDLSPTVIPEDCHLREFIGGLKL